MKIIKSLRIENLIIIALTMLAMRYCVADSIMKVNGFGVSMPLWQFIILVTAVILIAEAGYIINDYFDMEGDRINNKNNFAAQLKNKENALIYYAVLSLTGIILGGIVSWLSGYPKFTMIFFIAASILWFYSSFFKKQFIIGNLLIAFLAALVPMIVAVYEIPAANTEYATILKAYGINFMVIVYWIAAFAAYAFVVTLIREIIKDMEDIEGDEKDGAKTLPVVLGQKAAKALVTTLILLTIGSIALVYYKFLQNKLSLIYIVIAIIIPLIFTMIKVLTAKNSKDYKLCSTFVKIIMLTGIGYSAVACYIFSTLN